MALVPSKQMDAIHLATHILFPPAAEVYQELSLDSDS